MFCPNCESKINLGKDEFQLRVLKGGVEGIGLTVKVNPIKVKEALIPVYLGICKECGFIQIFSKQIIEKKGEENGERETTEGKTGL